MVIPPLVESERDLGAQASRLLLKDKEIAPTSLLWMYDDEPSVWRFMIVTKYILQHGRRASYTRVAKILAKGRLLQKLPLARVIVTSPKNPLIVAVKDCIEEDPNRDKSESEFFDLTVVDARFNGLPVAAMFIYKL